MSAATRRAQADPRCQIQAAKRFQRSHAAQSIGRRRLSSLNTMLYTLDAMRDVVSSIEGEWRRYKALGEGAFRQLRDEEIGRSGPGDGNSVAVIVWHIAGNLKSRFQDFLSSDGEKPWRKRDTEFETRTSVTRAELMEKWNDGW